MRNVIAARAHGGGRDVTATWSGRHRREGARRGSRRERARRCSCKARGHRGGSRRGEGAVAGAGGSIMVCEREERGGGLRMVLRERERERAREKRRER